MRPSDDNLEFVRAILSGIGFRESGTTQSHIDFQDTQTPLMSETVTTYRKGRRKVAVQEIFVNYEAGSAQRIAIILSSTKGSEDTVEMYEVEDILEHFREDIRHARISMVLSRRA